MAVLERPGEERPLGSNSLELGPVIPEADDDCARLYLLERLEEDVDALVTEQLAEVEDGRVRPCEEGLDPFGVPLVGKTLLSVARVRRIGAALGDQELERLGARARQEPLDVDSRRDDVDAVDVADDVLENLPDVLRADEDRLRAGEGLSPPRRELLVSAQRVLELRPVGLDRIQRACRSGDRTAGEDVVREDEIRRQVLPEGGRVGRDVPLALGLAQVREEARVESLVAVEDEDGEHGPDLRPDDLSAPQVVVLGARLLGEHDDLVPGAAPLARERARVHVGAGASEQVAVPEENPQDASAPSLREGVDGRSRALPERSPGNARSRVL